MSVSNRFGFRATVKSDLFVKITKKRKKKLKLFIEARKTMALSDINVNIQEQTIQLDDNELKLKCPFKLMISGSSGAGKSR